MASMKDVFLRRAGVWIFLVALAVRIGLILVLGSYRVVEKTEVTNVAVSLAQKGEFADAYGPGTGPTAHTAPIYPFLLSWIFRLLGTGTAGQLGQEIFSSIIASVACALLPSVAAAFDMGRSTGLWAGLWLALLPVNFWSETKGSFESAFTALALVMICWYFAVIWKRRQFSARQACAGGAIAGVGMLISPSILPVLVLLLAAGVFVFRKQLSVYIRFAGVFAGLAIAFLIPWAARNERVLGSLIFTRSNLGLELQVSNNDFAHAEHNANMMDHRSHENHPFSSDAARADEARIGEVAFARERRNQAMSWISSHPGRFFELIAARFALFWFPRMVRTPQTILIRLESLAGIVGFVLLARQKNNAKWIIGALWAGYPVIYYFVQAFARYRYPVDWSFVLLGAFALCTFSRSNGTLQSSASGLMSK